MAKIENVFIMSHFDGSVAFDVTGCKEGRIHVNMTGHREWDSENCCHGELQIPEVVEDACSEDFELCLDDFCEETKKVLNKAVVKVGNLCKKTAHACIMESYLKKHPTFFRI